MLRLLSSLLRKRRTFAAVVVGGAALFGSTSGVAAQGVLVATWSGYPAVSGCTYGGGAVGKFSCSSVAGYSTTCSYQVGMTLTGICAANLSANIANATFVTQTTYITYQEEVNEAVTNDFCWHGVNSLDGLGTVYFYPYSGGTTNEAVPVQLHITSKGHSVFIDGNLVASQSTPATISFSGSTLNVGTGNIVSTSGSFTFYCGLGNSTYGTSYGSYAGQLSGSA